MKQIKLAVIALFMLVSITNVSAQDENNPWVIGFGVNSVDQRVAAGNFSQSLEDFVGFDELSDNTLPSISRISIDRYLEKGFSLQLAGSINKLDNLLGDGTTPTEATTNADALYYAIDLVVKYDLNNLFGQTGWFNPYVALGGGYQNIDFTRADGQDGKSDIMLVTNLGFNTWFNDNIGLNFQTGYGHHFQPTGFDTFRHSIGLVVKFGGKDTDGDGVYDKHDACPEVAGLEEFKGCPDADGDGVTDADDSCPEVAGLAAMNGCPDADGDGIADKDDACPNASGTKANKGCPDADGDGVVDGEDKCADVAGPVANSGCPWVDTDGDSVLDKDDKCPLVAGLASESGCPVISNAAKMGINTFAKAILFNTEKVSFKSGVTKELDGMLAIMNEFPTSEFVIKGYTDTTGSVSGNLKLSNKRANAVKNYLVKNGIDASRLTVKGFGQADPIDSNKTRAGRANNRRVEVKVTN